MTHHFDPSAYESLDEIVTADPVVTPYSRWSDKSWYLEVPPSMAPSKRALHWTVEVPAELIDRFKLVAALTLLVRDARVGPGNANYFSVGARHAMRFMASHSILGFDEFGEDEYRLFKDRIHWTLTDPEGVAEVEADEAEIEGNGGDPDPDADTQPPAGEDATPLPLRRALRQRGHRAKPKPQGKSVGTISVATGRLSIWRDVGAAAPELRRLKVACMPFEPFGRGKPTPGEVAAKMAHKAKKAIPPLPDEVAKPILEAVHRLIMQPAEDVIELQRGFLRMDPRNNGTRSPAARRRLGALTSGFEFSRRDEGRSPWHAPIRPTSADVTGGTELRKLVTTIRDACAVVILGDTGVRVSEICSVEVEDREIDDGLPSCVTIETSVGELDEHFFMHGLLIKGRNKPEPEKWLLGARPLGSTWEPPGVRAIRVLERLLQPWRRLTGDPWLSRQLLLTFTGDKLPRWPEAIGPMTGKYLTEATRDTLATHVNLTKILQALVAGDPELAPYARTNGRCIRLHQWRKTFLRYLIRVDEGLLPAISQHFKHLTLAMTQNAYMPKDPALLDAADSVRSQEVARFLYEKRHGRKRPFSRLDATMAEGDRQVAELVGARTFAEAKDDLETFAEDHGLEIHSAAHGQCMAGLSPDQARCHRHAGRPAWEARAPNLAARTASLCVSCANFSASPSSAAYWRRQYHHHQTAWIESGYDPAFRVPQMRARQAAAILRQLQVPRPVILAKVPKPPTNPTREETRA